jgi:hypothetical protein
MSKLSVLILLALSVSVGAQTQHGKQTGCIGIGKCQQQGQQQGQTATATGGTSMAAGGASNATNTATTGNEANQQSSVTSYQDTRQTAPAVSPQQFHTSPCIKSWGGAAQTGWAGLGLGGGKVDKGCDIRETAEQFRNAGSMLAFCKLMIQEPSAQKAHVTMEDCMAVPLAPVTVQAPPQAAPATVEPPQIIVPAPQVTINMPPPLPAPQPIVAAPVKHAKHHAKPCHCTSEK